MNLKNGVSQRLPIDFILRQEESLETRGHHGVENRTRAGPCLAIPAGDVMQCTVHVKLKATKVATMVAKRPESDNILIGWNQR